MSQPPPWEPEEQRLGASGSFLSTASNQYPGPDMPEVEAQLDAAHSIQVMLRMAQCGTVAVEVWQGLMLVFLVQLKRRRAHMGIETCLNEAVLGLLLRVLPKALPDVAPVLSTIRPRMRSAMLRPPSCLLQIIDENILAFLPALVGDVLHGAAPSPECMEVLRRLSTAVMTSSLSVAISANEPAQELMGSGSQGVERQHQDVFHDSLQAPPTQNDCALEQAAPNEVQWQQQQSLQQPPQQQPHWLQPCPSSRAPAVLEDSSPSASYFSQWPVPVRKGSAWTPAASQDVDDTESLCSRLTRSTGLSSGYSRHTRSTIPSMCATMPAACVSTLPAGSNDGFDRRLDAAMSINPGSNVQNLELLQSL